MKAVKNALFFLVLLSAAFMQTAFLGYLGIISDITGVLGRSISFVSFGSFGYSSLIFPLILFVSFLDWKMDRKFPAHLIWGILGLFFLSLLIWSPHNNDYLINHKFLPSGYFGNIANLLLSSSIGTYSVKFFSAVFLIFCLYQFNSSKTVLWLIHIVYRQVIVVLSAAAKLIKRMIALSRIKNRSNMPDPESGAVMTDEHELNAVIH